MPNTSIPSDIPLRLVPSLLLNNLESAPAPLNFQQHALPPVPIPHHLQVAIQNQVMAIQANINPQVRLSLKDKCINELKGLLKDAATGVLVGFACPEVSKLTDPVNIALYTAIGIGIAVLDAEETTPIKQRNLRVLGGAIVGWSALVGGAAFAASGALSIGTTTLTAVVTGLIFRRIFA